MFAIAISKFLVLTTFGNSNLNIAKVLKDTFYSRYLVIKRKNIVKRQKLEQKNV